jgi:excisionase family DNA binding protein
MVRTEKKVPQVLSPRQVAKAIGVSEASLKRWCDKGMLPFVRTAGGHRRLPVAGVVQFLRQSGHPLIRPEVFGLPPAKTTGTISEDRSRSAVSHALESGDEEAMRRSGFDLYLARHDACEICDEFIAPAFRSIGDHWEHGSLEIFQERRACEIAHRFLHELRGVLPGIAADAPYALGGTLEGDPYTLPTAMVEAALREIGWRAESHGVCLPVDTLCAAIRTKRPRLFWLSVSTVSDEAAFRASWGKLYQEATACGAVAVLGGRGMTERLRQSIRFSACGDNLRHLVEFARVLHAPAAPATQAE